MTHLWVVECKNSAGRWTPVLYFYNMPGGGIHRTRHCARIAARKMQTENQYNNPYKFTVRYRIRKYIRIEEGLLSVLNDGWLPPHFRTKGLPRRTVKFYGG